MKRRTFFSSVATVGSAALITQLPNVAFAADGESVTINEEITFNHGHAVSLDIADIVRLLKETKANGPVIMDIQGKSGHAHSIEFSHQNLVDLLSTDSITVDSSKDAGHNHGVTLSVLIS